MALRGVGCEVSDILEPKGGDKEMFLLPSLPEAVPLPGRLWSLWAEAAGEVKPATFTECSLRASTSQAFSSTSQPGGRGTYGPHCTEVVTGAEAKLPVQGQPLRGAELPGLCS